MYRSLGYLLKGRKTIAAAPGDTVAALVRRLKTANIGAAPVVKDGRLVGIFTERDLLKRVVALGKDPEKLTIGKVMTKNPTTAAPATSVLEGLEMMRKNKCRHLPLMKGDEIVGIVSQRDIVTALLEMKQEEIEGLKELLDMLPIEPGVG